MVELGDADRLLAAKIIGTALHHARWRELSADEEAEAVTAIFDLAAGRADLLAYGAGILTGASEGALDEPRRRQAAGLLLKAGADPGLIPQWIDVGRHRAQAARQVPHTGIGTGWDPRRSGNGLVPPVACPQAQGSRGGQVIGGKAGLGVQDRVLERAHGPAERPPRHKPPSRARSGDAPQPVPVMRALT
jgi:hypothetical protein